MLKGVAGNLGEGTLVQYAGYLLDAHVSNVGKGELVNCKTGGQLFNDVHIELVDTPGEDDDCQSVPAEMSPHLRPEIPGQSPSGRHVIFQRFDGIRRQFRNIQQKDAAKLVEGPAF